MMKLVQDLGVIQITATIRKRMGIYECSDCKKHFEARTETVKHRNQERCNSCASKLRGKKHGMRHHPLNTTINNMIQRCENPNTDFYSSYGGRGIKVCTEWRENRENFFTWALANGWEEGLSIDRINVDLDYTPQNCRFVTPNVQAQNTRPLRSTNTSGYRGVSFHKTKQKWVAHIGINNKKKYLGAFETAEDASKAFIEYVKSNNLDHNCAVAQAMQSLIDG